MRPLAILLAAALAPAALAQSGYQPSRSGDGRQVRTFGSVGSSTTGRVTRAGDNRPRGNIYKDMATQIKKLETKLESTSAPAPSGGGEKAARGPVRIVGQVEEGPSWDQRVQEAGARLLRGTHQGAREALTSEDPAEALAALVLVKNGKLKVGDGEIVKVLEATRARPVAEAAVQLLGRRGGTEAEAALISQIQDQGPADLLAVEVLARNPSETARRALLARAAQATRKDAAGLRAIRAVATHPEPQTTVILRRLASDWSDEVRQAAEAALALRKKAGISLGQAFRPVPVGERPEDVAVSKAEMARILAAQQSAQAPSEPQGEDGEGEEGGGEDPETAAAAP